MTANADRPAAKRGNGAAADLFGQRVAAAQSALSPAARRVIRFIDQNRVATLASSAMELASSIGTSDATVVRAVQALGFDGLGDLRQALIASLGQRSTPADDMRRTLADVGETADRAIELVLDNQREALEAVEKMTILNAMKEAENDRRLVAQRLGIGKTTLYRRLKEYGFPLSRCPRRKGR